VLGTSETSVRNALIAAHLTGSRTNWRRHKRPWSHCATFYSIPAKCPPSSTARYRRCRLSGYKQTVDREDVLSWWQGALGELHATVRAQELHVTGPSGGLYASELFQHGRGEATVFIPVDGIVRSIGRVVPFVVPAAELAVLMHTAPSPTSTSPTASSVRTRLRTK